MIHKPNPQKELLQRKKQFAREHGRNYKSGAEVHLRREIFNENYKSMMEHNARSAGQLKSNILSFVGEIALSCIFFFFFMIGLHTRFEAGVETWTRKVKLKWKVRIK